MIDPAKLKIPNDIGKKVLFKGTEEGWIFAFSQESILVIYPPNKHAELTNPNDLDFLTEPVG